MIAYRARWIFPGDGPPLPRAVLEIASDGRVLSTSPHSRAEAVDLGEAILIPGLVNAHTHLEFSDLDAPLKPLSPFADWVRNLIALRRQRPADWRPPIARGCAEAARSGVTLLGEIATSDWAIEDGNVPSAPRLSIFRELLGLSAEAVDDQLDTAAAFLERARAAAAFAPGLSPHASYSLHPELFRGLCQLAREREAPVAMHLAEFPEELQLLATGTGGLVDLFCEMGLWRADEHPRGRRPLDFLRALSEAPRTLVIHGNLLADVEIEFLAAHPQMSVVYCPRTHAAMQSGAHPWRRLLARGANVALGTDSRATNPDLDLFQECRFLHRRAPELPASALLRMATLNGARALGEPTRGKLQPGCVADFCIVQPAPGRADHPEVALFEGAVAAVFSGGTPTSTGPAAIR